MASCTAIRSESATSEMSRPTPSEAKVSSSTIRMASTYPLSTGICSTKIISAPTTAVTNRLSRAKARYLPVSTSIAFTGATRNRSIWPLSRSRTIDSALRVMARCWMTSASTAGPKKLRTLGSVGATFWVFAVVGSAITSGDRFSTRAPELALGQVDPLGRGLADDLRVQGADHGRDRQPRQPVVDRVHLVPGHQDLGLLSLAQLLGGVLRRDHHQVRLQLLEPVQRGGAVIGHRDDLDPARRQVLVELGVAGQAGSGRNDHLGGKRLPLTGVAQAEEQHHQERAQHQREQHARAAQRLAQLLARERGDADQAAPEATHRPMRSCVRVGGRAAAAPAR